MITLFKKKESNINKLHPDDISLILSSLENTLVVIKKVDSKNYSKSHTVKAIKELIKKLKSFV